MLCCKVAVLILMTTACWEVACSSERQHQDPLIAKRATHASCILTTLDNTLDKNDTACSDVVQKLTQLYDSTDVVSDISGELSAFPTFCRSSCGQVIVNAWVACNAYSDIEDVANLLMGMCASDMGSTCYSNFDNLFDLLNDGILCYENFAESGICTFSCSTILSNGAQRYGCCVNVPIDYEDASEDINDDADTIFAECGVTRPNHCTNSPLEAPLSANSNKNTASLVLTFLITILHILM